MHVSTRDTHMWVSTWHIPIVDIVCICVAFCVRLCAATTCSWSRIMFANIRWHSKPRVLGLIDTKGIWNPMYWHVQQMGNTCASQSIAYILHFLHNGGTCISHLFRMTFAIVAHVCRVFVPYFRRISTFVSISVALALHETRICICNTFQYQWPYKINQAYDNESWL